MAAEADAVPATARLRITETFHSLQGEADAVGWPTFFIRLTGCPLRCHYCDTTYAFQGGEWRTIATLVEEARASGARYACVTGGEPLAQKNCLPLLTALCDAGFRVSLETSGAIDASAVDRRVVRVIDVKTPASGESERNLEPASKAASRSCCSQPARPARPRPQRSPVQWFKRSPKCLSG